MKKLILTAAVVCSVGLTANAQSRKPETVPPSKKIAPAAPAVNDDGTVKESTTVTEAQPAAETKTTEGQEQKKKPATKVKKEETATKPQ